jgi:hypothetical protein
MNLKISKNWTQTERNYLIAKLERRLMKAPTPEQIGDYRDRIDLLKSNPGAHILEANAEALLRGLGVERVEDKA